MPELAAFPHELDVRIDTARGGRIKRRDDGRVDYVSPLPSPFNYGSVIDTQASDGDREDAIVLGSRLEPGVQVRVRVLGRVRFVDAGVADNKWICGESLSRRQLARITCFFRFYAYAKGFLNMLRGEGMLRSEDLPTRYDGIELTHAKSEHGSPG